LQFYSFISFCNPLIRANHANLPPGGSRIFRGASRSFAHVKMYHCSFWSAPTLARAPPHPLLPLRFIIFRDRDWFFFFVSHDALHVYPPLLHPAAGFSTVVDQAFGTHSFASFLQQKTVGRMIFCYALRVNHPTFTLHCKPVRFPVFHILPGSKDVFPPFVQHHFQGLFRDVVFRPLFLSRTETLFLSFSPKRFYLWLLGSYVCLLNFPPSSGLGTRCSLFPLRLMIAS